MSIQTQAVLPQMRNANDLLNAIRDQCAEGAVVRPMHSAEYEVVEFALPDGEPGLIHVFGSTYVKEDLPELFHSPSVLISAEFNPHVARLIEYAAKSGNGYFRTTDQDLWTSFKEDR